MTDAATSPDQDLERMAKAAELFGAVRAYLIPVWNEIRLVYHFWSAMTRAYLADRWHLGRLAWRLPDWVVRRVPLEWVAGWVREQMNDDEIEALS